MPPQPSEPKKPAEPWHAMAPDDVLAQFATGPDGLTAEEAERRRGTYGPNRLPEAATRGPLARLLAQFNSLLIWVLLAAAALAASVLRLQKSHSRVTDPHSLLDDARATRMELEDMRARLAASDSDTLIPQSQALREEASRRLIAQSLRWQSSNAPTPPCATMAMSRIC